MLIGGAEDKIRDKVILSRFAEASGGTDGHVVVISTASSLGDLATERYRSLFADLGIGRVTGLRPEEREQADDADGARALDDATGVFLTGGNQLRLSADVGRPPVGEAQHQDNHRGRRLAGTRQRGRAEDHHIEALR